MTTLMKGLLIFLGLVPIAPVQSAPRTMSKSMAAIEIPVISHTEWQVYHEWSRLKPRYGGPAYVSKPRLPSYAGKLDPRYLRDGIDYANFLRFLTGESPLTLNPTMNVKASVGPLRAAKGVPNASAGCSIGERLWMGDWLQWEDIGDPYLYLSGEYNQYGPVTGLSPLLDPNNRMMGFSMVENTRQHMDWENEDYAGSVSLSNKYNAILWPSPGAFPVNAPVPPAWVNELRNSQDPVITGMLRQEMEVETKGYSPSMIRGGYWDFLGPDDSTNAPPWVVTLNPARYLVVSPVITVRDSRTGATWSSRRNLRVQALNNTIVFRFSNNGQTLFLPGDVFRVHITGITTLNLEPASLDYTVKMISLLPKATPPLVARLKPDGRSVAVTSPFRAQSIGSQSRPTLSVVFTVRSGHEVLGSSNDRRTSFSGRGIFLTYHIPLKHRLKSGQKISVSIQDFDSGTSATTIATVANSK